MPSVKNLHGMMGRRDAFTLLEVIISSLLSSVVLLLVYSSIDTAAKLSGSGVNQSLDDVVARSILYQIKDDLISTSISPADYLQSFATSSFESNKYAADCLSGDSNSSGVLLTERCVLIERRCRLDGNQGVGMASNEYWRSNQLLAYVVSEANLFDELADHLKQMGKELEVEDFKCGIDAGFHRCHLIVGQSPDQVRLVGVDAVFERPEVLDLQFVAFDGSDWERPTVDLIVDPLAVRIELKTASVFNESFLKDGRSLSRNSESDGTWHHLVTRVHQPLVKDR